jgi:hypothetical protein
MHPVDHALAMGMATKLPSGCQLMFIEWSRAMIYLPVTDPLDYEVIPPLPLDLVSQPDFPQVDFVRLMTKVSWDSWSNEVSETDQSSLAETAPAYIGLVCAFKWLAGGWRSWIARRRAIAKTGIIGFGGIDWSARLKRASFSAAHRRTPRPLRFFRRPRADAARRCGTVGHPSE